CGVPARSMILKAMVLASCLAQASPLAAQPVRGSARSADAAPGAAPGTEDALLSEGSLDARIAVMGLDALGMDSERVARLESLFRSELARLSRHPLPGRRTIERTVRRSRALRACSGDDACLADIGKALGVDVVVSGNVAALGDSYILNIKAVDVRTGAQLRRIASDPLRGNPDELIEAVRVAAYRLLAP